MKEFDLEKYESIFFNLIEGNYSKPEEEAILEEIEANSFLKFEWDNWQKAMLEDDSEAYALENAAFFDALKDDADAVKVVPIWSKNRIAAWLPYMSLAAACLLIVFMFTINLKQNAEAEAELVEVETKKVQTSDTQLQKDEVLTEENAVIPEPVVAEKAVEPADPSGVIPIIVEESAPQQELIVSVDGTKEDKPEDVIIDFDADESEIEESASPEIIIADASPTIPPQNEIVEEPIEVYQRAFTVTTETVKKKDRVISQRELASMNVRKLLQDKRIKLVNIGNKTYVQLESPDQETVLVGLSQ